MSIFNMTLSFLLIFCLSFNANAGKAEEQQKTLRMKDKTLNLDSAKFSIEEA